MSDPPSVYASSTPKARKDHRCCECRGTISKGETYHLFRGLWDSWGTYKTCSDCEILRHEIDARTDHRDDLVGFGHMYENVFEDRAHPELIRRFMDIRRKRGAKESPGRWMEISEEELDDHE